MHIFIFRRDLRIDDNKGWIAALDAAHQAGTPLLPLFIFNKDQIDPKKNRYYSSNAVQFMVECIRDLQGQLSSRLGLCLTVLESARDTDVLELLEKKDHISRVSFNADITPFARKRDSTIAAWCKKNNTECVATLGDYVLVDPSTMPKPYQVFSAFFKRYNPLTTPLPPVPCPQHKITPAPLAKWKLPKPPTLDGYYKNNPNILVHGGRHAALAILDDIKQQKYKTYDQQREFPNVKGTTYLSAYLKYGCASVREAHYAACKAYSKNHGLVREFFWRAFYDQLAYHFPNLLQGQVSKGQSNQSLRPKYDKIVWSNNEKHFAAWCQGKTGFPIVDAGMRQLNTTGYMHNRIRMVVASFLIKDLHIDWRKGERYFATMLVDYYPTANNGGWSWASGGGADAQQYNRIFNPWLQSKRYDAEANYIKTWVSELKDVPPKDIHMWFKTHTAHQHTAKYPPPIVDHATEAAIAKRTYAKALYSKT